MLKYLETKTEFFLFTFVNYSIIIKFYFQILFKIKI